MRWHDRVLTIYSPALVGTLVRLARISPNVVIAIAMKMRHPSEKVFFDLMATAGFHETRSIAFPLPGDVEIGEEFVYLYVYEYSIGPQQGVRST